MDNSIFEYMFNVFRSYKVTDIELIKYIRGEIKTICEMSYELRCALYEQDNIIYNQLLREHFGYAGE